MEMTLAFGRSVHQSQHMLALERGLARHGVRTRQCSARGLESQRPTLCACWGWRTGKRLHDRGHDVLVLERGYIGDRFAWTSLGWNGLNGLARCSERDDPFRFESNFPGMLRPVDETEGDYVLVIGQVATDASLRGIDLRPWYEQRAQEAREAYRKPVFFRPHPKARPGEKKPDIPTLGGTLADALAGAHEVITFNSNTGVESVLAGKRTIAWDKGSMAWDVCGREVGAGPDNTDRLSWASKLAWRQWRLSEIENGAALDLALEGFL